MDLCSSFRSMINTRCKHFVFRRFTKKCNENTILNSPRFKNNISVVFFHVFICVNEKWARQMMFAYVPPFPSKFSAPVMKKFECFAWADCRNFRSTDISRGYHIQLVTAIMRRVLKSISPAKIKLKPLSLRTAVIL